MIKLAIFFIAIFAIAFGVAWFADNPGQVEIVWLGKYIMIPFTVLLGGIIVLLIASILVAFLIRLILSAPRKWMAERSRRRSEKGYKALTQGLVDAAAGDVKAAKKQAKRADKLLDRPAMALLLKAQAAQLEGDGASTTALYEAMLAEEETEFLGLRGLFIAAQRAGDYDKALAYAQRARALHPKASWVLNALFEMETARGNWDEGLKALEGGVKSGLVPSPVARRRRAILLTQKAIERAAKGEPDKALTTALKAHDIAPDLQPAALLAARILADKGRKWRAAEVIETAWTAAPHPDLAAIYRTLKEKEPEKAQAKWLKGLADFNPEHFESKLLMAGQQVQLSDWSSARKTLAPLTHGTPTSRVCELMAEIEAQDPEFDEDPTQSARDWVRRTARAPRDTLWQCESCGSEHEGWSVLCSNCNAFDSLSWRTPAIETIEAQLEAPAEHGEGGEQEGTARGAVVVASGAAGAAGTGLAADTPQDVAVSVDGAGDNQDAGGPQIHLGPTAGSGEALDGEIIAPERGEAPEAPDSHPGDSDAAGATGTTGTAEESGETPSTAADEAAVGHAAPSAPPPDDPATSPPASDQPRYFSAPRPPDDPGPPGDASKLQPIDVVRRRG
ncbi:MAG: heme biosynthesis HemY N-terminal domain-containing protein [Pseudomonadota bacterium]